MINCKGKVDWTDIKPTEDEDNDDGLKDIKDSKFKRAIVTCNCLPKIKAVLRIMGDGTKGVIILTGGGNGMGFYLDDPIGNPDDPRNILIDALLNDGFKLIEIAWKKVCDEKTGYWVDGGIWHENFGSRTLACRYATLARDIYKKEYKGGLFAAIGNSAGSAQIAFSLCYYGLDENFDLDNLGGGPPPCPRDLGTSSLWTKVAQGYTVSAIQGFAGKEWARFTEPLLFDNPNLYYPNTYVRFFLGDRETEPECVETGLLYFNSIKSQKKSIHILKNTEHKIFLTKEGINALVASIREIAGI